MNQVFNSFMNIFLDLRPHESSHHPNKKGHSVEGIFCVSPQGHQAEGNHLDSPITPPSPADSGDLVTKECVWRWGQLSEVALSRVTWISHVFATWRGVCQEWRLEFVLMYRSRSDQYFSDVNTEKSHAEEVRMIYIGGDLIFGWGQGLFFQLRKAFRENQQNCNKHLDDILSNK